jgi:hypothetical protein
MEKQVAFSLGVIGVIGVSAASIWLSVAPKTNCVDEITEITNASNVPMAVLLAPESTLNIMRPLISKTTTTEKIDNVVVIAGITPAVTGDLVFMKVLIDVDTSKDDAVFKEVDSNLHKQPHQCRLNGKSYRVYTGKSLMPVE